VFYKGKAEAAARLQVGQLVVCDCLLNGEEKSTQTGGKFVALSMYGLSFEVIRTGPVNGNVRDPDLPNRPEVPLSDFGFDDIPF